MIERFWLSADGKTLMSRQEFEDPDVLENRGARYVAWDRGGRERSHLSVRMRSELRRELSAEELKAK